MNGSFSCDGYDTGTLGEGKILLWFLPNGCVFISWHRGISSVFKLITFFIDVLT